MGFGIFCLSHIFRKLLVFCFLNPIILHKLLQVLLLVTSFLCCAKLECIYCCIKLLDWKQNLITNNSPYWPGYHVLAVVTHIMRVGTQLLPSTLAGPLMCLHVSWLVWKLFLHAWQTRAWFIEVDYLSWPLFIHVFCFQNSPFGILVPVSDMHKCQLTVKFQNWVILQCLKLEKKKPLTSLLMSENVCVIIPWLIWDD